MALSDEQLCQRLRMMATDHHLSGDAVTSKWLNESAARIMELSGLMTSWHPSLTSNGKPGQVLEFKIKNPFEGEF